LIYLFVLFYTHFTLEGSLERKGNDTAAGKTTQKEVMLFLFYLLFLPIALFSDQTICLNMIVKNEADVITRCLASVKEVIDYWVIVDTGSHDKTQEIIQNYLKEIPGELHQREWKNFGENRTEALALARNKGDYILFMDADDVLFFEKEAGFPELTQDLYNMWRGSYDFTYFKPQLVRASLPWRWVGVTHEYLDCDLPYSTALLEGVRYLEQTGGATRKDPITKFWNNIHLLEQGLKEEPNHSRYAFYLAESYRDAQEPAKALEWYQKRVAMGGWEEEVFWAKFQIGAMLQKLGLPKAILIEAFLDAHRFRPHRAEPIYFIADLLNQEGSYLKSYQFIQSFLLFPQPKEKDVLFNMEWIQRYGIDFLLSISTYYLGYYDESIHYCDRILNNPKVPEEWRRQAAINREFPVLKKSEPVLKGVDINKDPYSLSLQE
jgi:glycosyltransferase involved in cell wall biosynthesis